MVSVGVSGPGVVDRALGNLEGATLDQVAEEVKKAAASGSSPEATTWLLLLIAGLAIAGGSMGSVVLRNPA